VQHLLCVEQRAERELIVSLQNPAFFLHTLSLSFSGLLLKRTDCSYPANSGWDILWKSYRKALCTNSISEYSSAGDIKAHIDSLGLKYDEFAMSHAYDITDCFDPESGNGERLLDFMTDQERFHRSLTPELRKGILDLLRNKCSTEKDGRVMFNSNLTCILVHA